MGAIEKQLFKYMVMQSQDSTYLKEQGSILRDSRVLGSRVPGMKIPKFINLEVLECLVKLKRVGL